MSSGTLTEITGSLVRAAVTAPLSLREVALVGDERLISEVIALDRADAVVQVYEDTTGLAPGDPLFGTGAPLAVELGPGLLGSIFDGVQRPLSVLAASGGDFIGRGAHAPALDRERKWAFTPRAAEGDDVVGGSIVGVVQETPAIEHPIGVPPGVAGRVTWIAPSGEYHVDDPVARIGEDRSVTLMQRWRVRMPRPIRERLAASSPLITGQRVLDTFFPLARGAAACMPGGFGTGKTVTQHQLCRWAAADVIVFVGCGERGNEITELLRDLPGLNDPRTGRSLMERIVLIANTSNMPVSAREASIFTAVTIGEYYRDLGLHVLLLADSISRWAEALREISGRLGEMPAEEGYPPYLSTALAGFFERAGRVTTLAGSEGSLTIIGAISPPAGDLTEPVTRHAQRFVRTFWTLDRQLASARVFPAVSVRESYSDMPDIAPEWSDLRQEAMRLLEDAARTEETARLVGAESLPERERFLLGLAAAFQEGFLQQSAYDAVDAFCAPDRQMQLLRIWMTVRRRGLELLTQGVTATRMIRSPLFASLQRMKERPELPAIAAVDKELAAC